MDLLGHLMLFKKRHVASYLIAMALLNGVIAWRSRSGVSAALPDFASFYTAGRILQSGEANQLYNKDLQEHVQRWFAASAVEKRKAILPYNHPPFEALLFAPLAKFSFISAYLVWLAFNLGLVCGLVLLLYNKFAFARELPFYFSLLAFIGFYPVVIALLQGQDSILVLFCYFMAFLGMRRGSDFYAGLWLSVALCKFQLVVPFVFPLFLARRCRLIAGWLAGGSLLCIVGLLVVGWKGLLSYPGYVSGTEQFIWGGMPNLRGITFALVPRGLPRTRLACLILGSAMLLSAMCYAWLKASKDSMKLAFALSLVGTVLLSYHLYLHDLSLVLLSVAIVFEVLWESSSRDRWIANCIFACTALLFCSPIYLLLSLATPQRLQLLAVVLLLFLTLVLKLIFRGSSASPTESSVDRGLAVNRNLEGFPSL